MSISTEGLEQPSTQGEDYNSTALDSANSPERIFPVGLESGSVIIIAHPDNSGRVHLGFDTDLTTNNGLTMEAGSSISMDINVSQQNIFFVGANAGDEVRWLAIN